MGGNATKTCRIAIVDDDENLCRSFARLLRAAGYLPATFYSAEAFLAESNPSDFACLVLDVQLPGMSGLELQNQFSSQGVETPVLFITAYDDPGARDYALAAGCVAYLRKADSASEVLDVIHKVVQRRAAES